MWRTSVLRTSVEIWDGPRARSVAFPQQSLIAILQPNPLTSQVIKTAKDRLVPHRIPRLDAMAVTLAEFAKEATEFGELRLAKLLVDAMNEARRRSDDIAGSIPKMPPSP